MYKLRNMIVCVTITSLLLAGCGAAQAAPVATEAETAATTAETTATTAETAATTAETAAAPASEAEAETAATVQETEDTIVASKTFPNIKIQIVLDKRKRTLRVIFGEGAGAEELQQDLDEDEYNEAYKMLHDETILEEWFQDLHKIR